MVKERCDRCYYWEDNVGMAGIGMCHRYPPGPGSMVAPTASWWCGDFKPREGMPSEISIFKYKMGTRLHNAFIKMGIKTVADLLGPDFNIREFSKVRCVGPYTIKELNNLIKKVSE